MIQNLLKLHKSILARLTLLFSFKTHSHAQWVSVISDFCNKRTLIQISYFSSWERINSFIHLVSVYVCLSFSYSLCGGMNIYFQYNLYLYLANMRNSYDNRRGKKRKLCDTKTYIPKKMIFNFFFIYLFLCVCVCLSLIIHIQLYLID